MLLLPRGDRPPKLATYRGQGRLRSWVQVTVVRTALELRRKSRPQDSRDDEELVEAADLGDDPELRHIKDLYRREFRGAFQTALSCLSSQERNLLRMYLVDGLSIDEVGAVYHVHRATAARRIAAAREKLLGETRKGLINALKLDKQQFESVMNVIRSHLDLSLDRVFRSSYVSG
jgi:RNA polymerase sigma-70 factor (ECF subfamily)